MSFDYIIKTSFDYIIKTSFVYIIKTSFVYIIKTSFVYIMLRTRCHLVGCMFQFRVAFGADLLNGPV